MVLYGAVVLVGIIVCNRHISSCSFGRITVCSQYHIPIIHLHDAHLLKSFTLNKFQAAASKVGFVAFNYFEFSVYRYVRAIILVESLNEQMKLHYDSFLTVP
jgi:hypothetical protein